MTKAVTISPRHRWQRRVHMTVSICTHILLLSFHIIIMFRRRRTNNNVYILRRREMSPFERFFSSLRFVIAVDTHGCVMQSCGTDVVSPACSRRLGRVTVYDINRWLHFMYITNDGHRQICTHTEIIGNTRSTVFLRFLGKLLHVCLGKFHYTLSNNASFNRIRRRFHTRV